MGGASRSYRAGASAGDALWVADADGTSRREIIPADAGIHIHWPAWSGDGYVYFIRTRSTIANLDQSDIYRIRADGGTAEPVVTTPRRAMFPMVAPGDGGLFFASDADSVDLSLYWRPTGGAATRSHHAWHRRLLGGQPVTGRPRNRGHVRRRSVSRSFGSHPRALASTSSPSLMATRVIWIRRLSPRAKRLVFSSSRGRQPLLWSSELDGSSATSTDIW